jgi:predicted ATPase/class 3 adenylate cyclase
VSELPTGTVTFLFTDLEGSTRLWEEHPDEMQEALARHDAMLRDAIEAHGGLVVKTTGDGVHAAFAVASDAIDAAVAAQLAVQREDWNATGPLRVRMGIHTGAAEVRDGDYYGTALNRAARLMSAAHGGQVVVSLATRELVDDGAVEFIDVGEHRLRDLAQPVRVFQVVHDELECDFPPLLSLDVYAGNLPAQVTSFVGRAEELAAIVSALEHARLVTLTGVGGVGKTRLALQVAADLLPEYAAGVWVCGLAAAGDDEAMVQVVASSLGVTPRAAMSLAESIVDYLRGKELLLVLDNCEHLLDAAAALAAAVMRDCPRVTLLATSREALDVAGEQAWPVPPLSRADDSAALLFSERAHAARPDFVLDETTTPAVREICERLDGVPLAIELAAARVGSMAPSDIAARLDERFRLLTGSRRSAVERHQTLRSAVEWSHSLLDENTKTVFARLGVFAGSFDTRAAEEIVSGESLETWDVVDALRDLVAKSIVTIDDTIGGSTRYQMLETLRAYARERLDEQGDADRWRRRHAAFYADHAEGICVAMFGPDWLDWLPRVRADLDDLRAAVTWALESGDDDDKELAVRTAAALTNLACDGRGNGIHAWIARCTALVERSTPGRRLALLGADAFAAWADGDHDHAVRRAAAAVQEPVTADCPAPMWAYAVLALEEVFAGEPDEGLKTLALADERFRAAGVDEWHVARIEQVRSYTENLLGLPTARDHAEACMRIAQRLKSPTLLAGGHFNIANTTWRAEPEVAIAALEATIELSRAGASFVAQGLASGLLAQLESQAGNARAIQILREAVVESNDSGDRVTVAVTLDRAVLVLSALGQANLAAELGGALHDGILASIPTLPFHELPAREAALEDARRALGDERYDRAAALGASRSYDELVAHVIAELDRLIEERDG